MAEDFSKALISSYDDTDMTCYLSTVLDALQGTDVNFEIVKSQTVRPLKLFYSHNKASVLRAFIFAQSRVNENIYEAKRRIFTDNPLENLWNRWTASEYAHTLKERLQDKEALAIDEVEVYNDLSKAETIQTIQRIKESSIEIAKARECNVGHVFVTVGFHISDSADRNRALITELDGPLSDTE